MVIEEGERVKRPWVRRSSGRGMSDSRMGLMSLSLERMLLKMEERGLVVKVHLYGMSRNGGLAIHAMSTHTSSGSQHSQSIKRKGNLQEVVLISMNVYYYLSILGYHLRSQDLVVQRRHYIYNRWVDLRCMAI